jgi:hypothetical protein
MNIQDLKNEKLELRKSIIDTGFIYCLLNDQFAKDEDNFDLMETLQEIEDAETDLTEDLNMVEIKIQECNNWY